MKRQIFNGFYISDIEQKKTLGKLRTFKIYVQTPLGVRHRDFTFMWLGGKRLLVDAITGSIYNTMTGFCSSTNQLKLIGNPDGLQT